MQFSTSTTEPLLGGSIKFGVTPGGGGIAGVCERSSISWGGSGGAILNE
jgi:hypothetical protein